MFKNGIRGLGDMVGEYGARLATFDCELEDLFCRHYFAPTRSWLETVHRARGIYRIPWEEAPEPFGVNIVRLVADEGAREFAVDFRGLHDPDCYSDWRACIVAVGHDGKRRYSPMWNKGRMAMKCRPDDCAYWLTVAATPTALCTGNLGQSIYSGRHAYRYPWSVQLSAARPGTPRNIRADLGEIALLYPVPDSVPQPHDTAAGKRYLRKLTGLLGRATNVESQARAEMDRMKKGKRHANGGGWVADGAKVAATAYVGPDAMVLGSAQVLDRAIVEDYAVVTGDAVVSDHARVSGRAVVEDGAKVNGYSRTWAAVGGTDVASTVPKRLGADTLHKFGLWANYAMDRDENTLLEDWYRFARGADRRYGRHLGPNLNGYLYGRPAFVVDGDRRGFRFDGKTQYGELCPRVADLGAITVETALKWEGQGVQTIFDFGSSPNSCFVLKAAQSGRAELVATVDGKTVARLTAKKALPQNEWVSLRVEMDGSKAALWMNGDKVAETPSSFRPCDAFPAGREKRNFLAASRDGSGHFRGIIDRVVVYHTVHEDFGKLPAPIRDAPIRPSAELVEAVEKSYGNVAELDRKIRAGVEKMMRPYGKLKEQQEARIRELKERDPAFLAAEAKLEAAKRAAQQRKSELGAEFDRLPETIRAKEEIDELRRQSRQLHSQAAKLETDRLGKDEQLAAIQAQRKEAAEKLRALDRRLRTAFEKRPDVVAERAALAELRKRIDQLRRQREKLEKEALEKDEELAALQARRKETDDRRREADKALREELKTCPELVEIDKRIAAARQRRDDATLGRKERDQAASQESDFRRKRDHLWDVFRKRSPEYNRCSSILDEVNRKIRDRQNALRARVRESSAAGRKCDALEADRRDRDRALPRRFEQFLSGNAEYARLDAQVRDLGTKYRDRQSFLRDELRRTNPTVGPRERQRTNLEQAAREKDRALSQKRDLYISKRSAETVRDVGAAEKALKDATEKALAPYIPEKLWIGGFGYQAFRGYYNTNYGAYIRDHVRAQVGGGEMREDLGLLKGLQKTVAGDEGWSTRVDWDWRMRQEADGTINELPLMQNWIRRARGPVVTEKPAGAGDGRAGR
ncbi:MAG: hypothetical protein AMK72_07350 [Planctomycetes bacterium SM23_25]|nr:MAG: hypothetical protein AMK72_07350 [Planctomycetes bacterium SM23_25]